MRLRVRKSFRHNDPFYVARKLYHTTQTTARPLSPTPGRVINSGMTALMSCPSANLFDVKMRWVFGVAIRIFRGSPRFSLCWPDRLGPPVQDPPWEIFRLCLVIFGHL